jgi:hypothetical protein
MLVCNAPLTAILPQFTLTFPIMPASDWLELATLGALSKHLVSIVAAGFSFFLTTSAFRWFVGPGTLSTCIEYMDKGILFILVLWFTYQMLLLLWAAREKFPNGTNLISLVA